MFVPDLNISTLLGMKNPPQIYNKFNKKDGPGSAGSNFSNELSEKKG
jgi:hypothetical protein